MTPSVVLERPADREAELRGRPGETRFPEIRPIRAVMVDGEGQAGEATFGARMPDLYGTAYGLCFDLARGRRHELSLGDPRRSAPERLRTLIRQPVEPSPPA
jgi:hypothetical protein